MIGPFGEIKGGSAGRLACSPEASTEETVACPEEAAAVQSMGKRRMAPLEDGLSVALLPSKEKPSKWAERPSRASRAAKRGPASAGANSTTFVAWDHTNNKRVYMRRG